MQVAGLYRSFRDAAGQAFGATRLRRCFARESATLRRIFQRPGSSAVMKMIGVFIQAQNELSR